MAWPCQSHPHPRQLPIILLLLLLFASSAAAATAEPQDEQQPITRPGCPDKCGNMSIPFPFGVKPGCFLEAGFEVTCNTSSDPPRAFLALNGTRQEFVYYTYTLSPPRTALTSTPSSPVELMDISVGKSEARAYGAVASHCTTNATGYLLKLQQTRLGAPFQLSVTRNVLIGVGSSVQPTMTSSLTKAGAKSDDYKVSCLSNLNDGSLQDATNGTCSGGGGGCCQADWPPGGSPITMFGVMLNLNSSSALRDNTPCNYGMLVERSWYNYSTADMYGLEVLPDKFPRGVPFVMDFAVRDAGECPAEGQEPPPGYACASNNSYCANASSGQGYVCKCRDHYDGNPYIANGCQDVCELRKQRPSLCDLYPCSTDGICKNSPGDCPCAPGMKGDGKAGVSTDKLPQEHPTEKKFPLAAKVTVGTIGVVVAILVVVAVVVRRRQGKPPSVTLGSVSEKTDEHITRLDKGMKVDLVQKYTYEELMMATGNFCKDSELGRGNFGVVYKGTLENKKVIAVKKLQRKAKVEVEQLTNEVSILSGLKHKNLVKLEGYCVHNQECLLCYEYLPDGTLEDRLHGKHANPSLSWKERHHILRGICSGLRYLHEDTPNDISVMHMDLKTDNILLQKHKNAVAYLTPKIADFGISRNLDTDKQHEYVDQIVGNVFCMPREFIERGKASLKVDIYSFGLVILEMVTGKSARSGSSKDDPNLYGEGFIKHVREHRDRKDTIDKIKDASLETDCHYEIEKCIEIALDCVLEDPAKRPDIATIARRLADISDLNKQGKY